MEKPGQFRVEINKLKFSRAARSGQSGLGAILCRFILSLANTIAAGAAKAAPGYSMLGGEGWALVVSAEISAAPDAAVESSATSAATTSPPAGAILVGTGRRAGVPL